MGDHDPAKRYAPCHFPFQISVVSLATILGMGDNHAALQVETCVVCLLGQLLPRILRVSVHELVFSFSQMIVDAFERFVFCTK